MRSLSLVLAMLASAVFGMILMVPSSSARADALDRVQRACAHLEKGSLPPSQWDALGAYTRAHQNSAGTALAASNLIDSRLYQLFCGK